MLMHAASPTVSSEPLIPPWNTLAAAAVTCLEVNCHTVPLATVVLNGSDNNFKLS